MARLLLELSDLDAPATGQDGHFVTVMVGGLAHPALQISPGLWAVEIDDTDLQGDIEIMVDSSPLAVNSGQMLTLLASQDVTLLSRNAAGSQFLDPATRSPVGDAYEGRVRLSLVDELPDPRLGGVPGAEPLPVNAVAQRVRSIYLSPGTYLDAMSGPVAGELLEFESVWEPLGWATDTWLSTEAVPAGADARETTTTVVSRAALEDRAAQQARDRTSGSSATSRQSQEAAHSTARQRASSQGFRAGLGRQTSSGATLTLDPIAALTNAVTGAVQIGYSASSATGNIEANAGLEQAVRTSVDELAERVSIAESQISTKASDTYQDTRGARAFRNPWWRATHNVGEFSLVRQWRVTTVLARRRGVVFLPIRDLGKDFSREDVFLHRDVLRSVLSDQTLVDALDAEADDFDPDRLDDAPVAWGPKTVVQSVRVMARTQDRAAGPGSKVSAMLTFQEAKLRVELAAKETGSMESAEVLVGHKLVDLRAWSFLYKKSRMSFDKDVHLSEVTLVFTLKDGDKVEQMAVPVGDLHLRPDREVVRGRGFDLPSVDNPLSADDRRRRFARLKCHLDANRAGYRLAIDLVTDPATRAARLGRLPGDKSDRQQEDPLVPQDLRPVGVAGTHLAFLNGADGSTEERPPNIQQLVTTPETGTYFDAVPGHVSVGTDFIREQDPPRVVLGTGTTFAWPDAVALDRPARATTAAAGAAPIAPDAAAAGASELGASLTAAIAALGKLGEALKAADESAKESTATAPAPTAPESGTPSEEAGEPVDTPAAETPAEGTAAAPG